MARRRHRLRIDRVMVKADGVTVMLMIVSRMSIGFYIWRLVQHGQQKAERLNILGNLTLRQLDCLIEKLELRLTRFKTPHDSRTAVRSSTFVVNTQGDCVKCTITFIERASARGDGSSTTAAFSSRQLAKLVGNLKRERAFAARETRTHM